MKWRRAFALLAIVGAGVLAYSPALHAGFVFDDHVLIEQGDFLQGPLWRIWFSGDAPDYWPLTYTSFWLELRGWGMWAPGYHAVNVVLHVVAAVLLWRVLSKLGVPGAWLAGLLFAVHPVAVESVAWISERKNTLSAVLFLGTVLAWLRAERRRAGGESELRSLALPLGIYTLALLAKTSVVTLPFVLLGVTLVRRGRLNRRDVLRTVPFFVLALALGVVTVGFQATHATGGEIMPRTAAVRIGGAAWALLAYLQKAWAPVHLGFVYPRWPVEPSSPLYWLPLAVVVAGAALVVRSWKTRAGPVAWALAFQAVMLLPVLGLLDMSFLHLAPMSNHFGYLALMAPAALTGYGLSLLSAGRLRPLALAGLALVGWLGATTFQRASAFQDDLTLWALATQEQPASLAATIRYGDELAARGRAPEALAVLESFAQRSADEVDRRRALALWLIDVGRLDEALGQELTADSVRPDRGAQLMIAKLFLEAGRPQDAVTLLTPLLTIMPRSAETRFLLGAALVAQGQREEARQLLLEGLALDRGNARLLSALAVMDAPNGRDAPSP